MRSVGRAVFQLGLALVAAGGCVAVWLAAQTVVEVAPVTDGEPITTSVVYDPPMLALALLLAGAGGVLGVLGVTGLCRRETFPPYTP